jgi:hypothetical protein
MVRNVHHAAGRGHLTLFNVVPLGGRRASSVRRNGHVRDDQTKCAKTSFISVCHLIVPTRRHTTDSQTHSKLKNRDFASASDNTCVGSSNASLSSLTLTFGIVPGGDDSSVSTSLGVLAKT